MAKYKLTSLPNVKRFYMPGVEISCKCNGCDEDLGMDFSDHYMSYPNIGETSQAFYCQDCDIEYEVKYNFNVTVELDQIGEPVEL